MSETREMKALSMSTFGDASVLAFGQLPVPAVGPRDVLIRVGYAGVNPVDAKIRKGYIQALLPHRFPIIPGWDVSGVVEAVGDEVKGFAKGDRVFAYARKPEVKDGAYAEFIALDEMQVVSAPETISPEKAAAVPLVSLTAWQALHDFSGIKAGMRVLVLGASGSVGQYAVQFAALEGAEVVVTASERNREKLKSFGASEFFDYSDPRVWDKLKERSEGGFDLVFDTVGGETLAHAYDLVRPHGVLASIVELPSEEKAKERSIKSGFVFVAPDREQLELIRSLVDSGKIRVLDVDVKPFDEAIKVHELMDSGKLRGKVVLQVASV